MYRTDTLSPTTTIMDNMALYGATRNPEYRPLPELEAIELVIGSMMEATAALVSDTSLEDDPQELLWSQVNMIQRQLDFIEKKLDDNELDQRVAQREQDGSEVKSLELGQLTHQGQTLIEQRDTYEEIRDCAAEHYKCHHRISMASTRRFKSLTQENNRLDDRQPRFHFSSEVQRE